MIVLKVKFLSKKGDVIRFSLSDATPAFANTLRRIMISEVPTMAIDVVDFQDNTSTLFDEVLAHRLGLVPIKFDPSKFNMQDDCKCGGKGCSLCQVVFVLEKTGPCMAYAGDMKSSNKNVSPAYPKIPIIELLENQRLKFEAIAKLGLGINHAKWQAANAAYQYSDESESKTKSNIFEFNVESISGLTPDYIVSASVKILQNKANEFKTELEKLK